MKDTDFTLVSPDNIWNYKQNHPELVIYDLKLTGKFTDEQLDLVRKSMLARGVNKWLKVRRDLISYKKALQKEITRIQLNLINLKKVVRDSFVAFEELELGKKSFHDHHAHLKKQIAYKEDLTKLKTLIQIRQTLKDLCMTERWQVWQGKRLEDMNDSKYKKFEF
jgi:hypothetical protein